MSSGTYHVSISDWEWVVGTRRQGVDRQASESDTTVGGSV